ncbi:LysR family transcriptional regulator [Flavobacterium sp. HJSW_4]|uniref:LysR family transcriptional regulator n=1 Tax=Flavobacterium sp. HJSW_4 TaxID=3344660 RepID=UPI0035F49678
MVRDFLDLDLLHTFVLAAELKSFTKAANQVFRTQSAVTLQMQRLEEITGHKLFMKNGRTWRLTNSGDLLLGYARELLDINNKAMLALTEASTVGQVRLGIRIDFSEKVLTSVLEQFSLIYPQIQIEIIVDREEVLMQKLDSGKLDLIVNFGKNVPDSAIPVGQVSLRWIGNGNESVILERPLPLLLFDAPCIFREIGIEALQKANLSWRPVLTASSVTGIWAAIRVGLGITIRTEIGLPFDCIAFPLSSNLPVLPKISIFILMQSNNSSLVIKSLTTVLRNAIEEQLSETEKN